MVSQPSMPRTLAHSIPLPALLLCLCFLAGCGQNEGGRCQINSDCASGLVCSDNTGNGVCRSPSAVANPGTDAGHDAAADLMSAAGPETQDLAPVGLDTPVDRIEVGMDASEDRASVMGPEAAPAAVDVTALDTEPSPVPVDAGGVDGGAVDAGTSG